MADIIKYNVLKDGTKVVTLGGGTFYNKDESPSTTGGSTPQIEQYWQRSTGSNSLIPTGVQNVADGSSSVAVGVSTTTSNDGELACGTYNRSTYASTLFSVGDGDSTNNRHNVFEASVTGISATNANIEGTLGADYAIFDNAKVNGLLDANQLQAVSAYVQTLLSDSITTDYLTVTKAAHFFKLIIDEIKATQGQVIITPANAKLDKVDEIEGGWRCYFRSKDAHGQEISNSFEVDDQVVCQTFNVATGVSYNVSNKYYWRKITATGSTSTTISGETVDAHYFDLSESDCDLSSMTPSVGDECVQLGNRTDTTRQAAIVISAYNSEFLDKGLKAPSIVQYAGINDYNLSNHRLNVISNGLNEFKGSYNNNSGKNIETIISETASTLDGKITTLSGTVSSHTQSISSLVQTDEQISASVSSNTASIGTLNDNLGTVSGTVTSHTQSISQLQQTSSSLTSTVSSHTQSITNLNSNVNSLSGSVSANSSSIATLQQTSSSLTSTVSSHTQSITTLSGSVSANTSNIKSLSGSVTANTSSISQLQQTSSSLTSTVSSHTQSISTLSGDVGTIKSDYVTSSVLNQTASGISATVISDIDGKLLNTGININTNKITMSSDNTEFVSASGSKTWLVGKSSTDNTIFELGRSGNDSPTLRFQKQYKIGSTTYINYNEFTTEGLNINANYGMTESNSAALSASRTETKLILENQGTSFGFRVYNGAPQVYFGSSWQPYGAGGTVKKITSNAAYTLEDGVAVVINTVNADISVNLPTNTSANAGRVVYFKCRTGTFRLKCTNKIQGTEYGIQSEYGFGASSIMVICDGDYWIVYNCS